MKRLFVDVLGNDFPDVVRALNRAGYGVYFRRRAASDDKRYRVRRRSESKKTLRQEVRPFDVMGYTYVDDVVYPTGSP